MTSPTAPNSGGGGRGKSASPGPPREGEGGGGQDVSGETTVCPDATSLSADCLERDCGGFGEMCTNEMAGTAPVAWVEAFFTSSLIAINLSSRFSTALINIPFNLSLALSFSVIFIFPFSLSLFSLDISAFIILLSCTVFVSSTHTDPLADCTAIAGVFSILSVTKLFKEPSVDADGDCLSCLLSFGFFFMMA